MRYWKQTFSRAVRFSGQQGLRVASLLLCALKGFHFCFAGLTNGQLVVFRLALASCSEGDGTSAGLKGTPEGATVVNVGVDAVVLHSLPEAALGSTGFRRSASSPCSKRNRRLAGEAPSPLPNSTRGGVGCVVCCSTTPVFIHVSDGGVSSALLSFSEKNAFSETAPSAQRVASLSPAVTRVAADAGWSCKNEGLLACAGFSFSVCGLRV